ncbi:MAG: phosphate ABC transporter permease subunit PstC [Alphaproteobacteria bacterium]|nr:phosphate ABC transporter permease subunit PstC [Alphaproteobacteria bacterium]
MRSDAERWDRVAHLVFAGAAAVCLATLGAMFALLVVGGLDAFIGPGSVSLWPAFLGDTHWAPSAEDAPRFGVLGMVVSTLLTGLVGASVAAALGLGVAAWLVCVASPGVRAWVRPVLALLAALPTVVLGLIGVAVFAPALARLPGASGGLNALNGALLLSFMALPTVATLAESALSAVPAEQVRASLALGADRWQTLTRVIVPGAKGGLIAAALLGAGRAMGETMAVLMACGNAVGAPGGLLDPARTLTATLAIEFGEVPRGALHHELLLSVALLLFLGTFAVNLAGELLRGGAR